MKILAFAGSNSRKSINKQLVSWVATQFPNGAITILDLNDFEMPLFGVDYEAEQGIPQLAHDFASHIDAADLILISLAENNGAYSVAFKNVFDWVSRIPQRSVFEDKPIFLMATSPGKRGGSTVLSIAEQRFPFNGGKILETFSLPSFGDNFNKEEGIVHDELKQEVLSKIESILTQFNER